MARLLNLIPTLLPIIFTLLAQTGEPSREPVLRIETGMHIAVIKRIGIDRAGKFLVTRRRASGKLRPADCCAC